MTRNNIALCLSIVPLALVIATEKCDACLPIANNGSVQFYLSTGSDSSGDLSFRNSLQDFVIAECDLNQIGVAVSVPSLAIGNLTIDISLLNDDGTVSPVIASTFASGILNFPGVMHFVTLVNQEWQGLVSPAQMRLDFSTPVRAFGTWIFDDENDANHQFVMHVTLVGGQTFTSPILDEGSIGWVVEGFLGVVATTGIESVIVESQDPDGSLSMDPFELDHMQVAPAASSYCSAVPNSTGGSAAMSATGSANLADNNLTLTAEPVPNQFFLFFYGSNQQEAPFGNGFLCVSGGIARINPPGLATGSLAMRAVDLPSIGITSPGSLNFQCWYRDPTAGGSLFNLSNGLSIPFAP